MQRSGTEQPIAYRAGRLLGSVLNRYLKREARFASWIITKGVPRSITILALWVLKLSVAGLLVYVTYWIALIVGALVVLRVVGIEDGTSGSMSDDEWRNGHAGYGRYVNGFFVDEP